MTQIATIAKNKRETLVVELSEFKGHNLVSLRVWVPDGEGGMKPTTKGVTLAVTLLPEVTKAFVQAEAEAKRLGLLTEGQA